MIVSVDRDSCAATGGCAQLVPDVFSIGSDGIVEVLVTSPDESLRALYSTQPTSALLRRSQSKGNSVAFLDRLDRAWSLSRSNLCVGLDPDPSKCQAVSFSAERHRRLLH